MERRKFLQFGTSILPVLGLSSFTNNFGNNNPIVLSTWNDGLETNKTAWQILKQKGTALDAVEQAAITAENMLSCCVGLGANPDRDGFVTLDASIMDNKGNCGAVAFLEQIKHPVSVARKLMENTPHVFMAGEGAQQFAIKNGFTLEEKKLSADAQKAYDEWLKKSNYQPQVNRENKTHQNEEKLINGDKNNHDTMGIIAMDVFGNLSGSCTTSGQAFKMRGRVGDVPVIGGGLFVDNEIGAAVATGQGEDIIRISGCHTIIEYMRQGHKPEMACKKTIERLVKLKGKEYCKKIQVCFIAIDKKGNTGAYSLQEGFTYAVATNSENNNLKKANFLL